MVPRLRLILLALVTVIPLLGVGFSDPAWRWPASGVLALVVASAGVDAGLGRRKLAGVRVFLPERLRWVQDRADTLEIGIETLQPLPLVLRVALAHPREIQPAREDLTAVLPAQPGRHFFPYECRPNRRGLFFIEGCHYETASPWGLWDVRGQADERTECRVYPSLESERRQVASLFLRTSRSGTFATRLVGQGRDFEKLREYVPGDSYPTIHWKASARRGHPITKVFQIEKTQEVYVIIDASRLAGRLQAPGDAAQGTRLDRYIAAALVLGVAAEKQSDLFGLVTFSDRVLNFVRARNGKEHYGACREALYRLEPQPVSPDFEELASFIRLRLRRRSLLIILTDLDDPVLAESFQQAIESAAGKHLVLVQMLQPGEIRPVFTNPSVAQTDQIYQDLAHHFAWHDLRQLTLTLRRLGVGLSLFSPDQFSAQAIAGYLRVKERQLL